MAFDVYTSFKLNQKTITSQAPVAMDNSPKRRTNGWLLRSKRELVALYSCIALLTLGWARDQTRNLCFTVIERFRVLTSGPDDVHSIAVSFNLNYAQILAHLR